MPNVIRLLWIKILGTALLAVLPMLLMPQPLYLWLGFPQQPTMLFLRLYGLSTAALLVGYFSGIQQARAGQFPAGVLRMGLASNGGQGLAITVAGFCGAFTTWGVTARLMMWAICAFILAIAVAIAMNLLNRNRLDAKHLR